MGLELERQYVAQGRYGASIDTEIEELPRNRVNVKINVEEGLAQASATLTLLVIMPLRKRIAQHARTETPQHSLLLPNDDKYAREKLSEI